MQRNCLDRKKEMLELLMHINNRVESKTVYKRNQMQQEGGRMTTVIYIHTHKIHVNRRMFFFYLLGLEQGSPNVLDH